MISNGADSQRSSFHFSFPRRFSTVMKSPFSVFIVNGGKDTNAVRLVSASAASVSRITSASALPTKSLGMFQSELLDALIDLGTSSRVTALEPFYCRRFFQCHEATLAHRNHNGL